MGMQEITSIHRNQMFGYADKRESVSFFAAEYNVEMSTRGTFDTVAPALIFDDFKQRDDLEGTRYLERKEMCVAIHELIRGAGYVLANVVWHAHSEGDMVRCEYYKGSGDGWTSSELRVVYSPTDYMPEGAIILRDKQQKPMTGVYYTVGYEEGQLTYLGAAELDGRPNRSISISAIEGKVWHGTDMPKNWLLELTGLGLSRVTSMTKSETQEGWCREYTGNLRETGEAVEIVVKNFHWRG
jgi:hypothetical protein